jgi:hypothetical protein
MEYLLNCVYIPYKAGRHKSGQESVSNNQKKASVNSSHVVLVLFLPSVTAQGPETTISCRITSYTKVRERKVIS